MNVETIQYKSFQLSNYVSISEYKQLLFSKFNFGSTEFRKQNLVTGFNSQGN